MSQFEVIIIGGGIVGAATACALALDGVTVALVEAQAPPAGGPRARDPRMYAITRASERIFRSLGIWDAILAQDASAFTDMEVWDAQGSARLHFDCAELGERCLGYIVEPRSIHSALMSRLDELEGVTLYCPNRFESVHVTERQADVQLDDGRRLTAAVVMAADGVRSPLRTAVGIEARRHDYRQSSLVALVKPADSHLDTAWQRFLPGGPLAFLPLGDGWCSIVWTMPSTEIDRVLALDKPAFHAGLAAAFASRLGEIVDSGERQAYPLNRVHADHYVSARLALVGDAAHAIHPLAGQGVNLGLLDAAAIAEVISSAIKAGKDPGAMAVLRRYERWRRSDVVLMMAAMDGLNRLFSNADPTLGWIRNFGLSLFGQVGPGRHLLMRHAMGLGGDLPARARKERAGEPLPA
ncbi:MAG: UbiH/UbiF/VisC/COQ6 family ubiquinone biosynthesis hydroxylase [Gammaproteobacteria bacterium]